MHQDGKCECYLNCEAKAFPPTLQPVSRQTQARASSAKGHKSPAERHQRGWYNQPFVATLWQPLIGFMGMLYRVCFRTFILWGGGIEDRVVLVVTILSLVFIC